MQQMANIGISVIILFGFVLTYYWAIKMINVSKAAVMLLLSPGITLVIGVTILREPAPLQQLIVSAILSIVNFWRRKLWLKKLYLLK